jgi:hypothetical protein
MKKRWGYLRQRLKRDDRKTLVILNKQKKASDWRTFPSKKKIGGNDGGGVRCKGENNHEKKSVYGDYKSGKIVFLTKLQVWQQEVRKGQG